MRVSARDSCYRTTIMLDLPVIVARIHRTTDKNIRNISPSMCERFANIFVTYSVRALAWVSCCRSKLLRASVAIAPLRGSFPPHFVRQDKKTYVNASFFILAEDSGCISGKNYFLRDLRFELLNNLFLFPYNINPVITTEMEIITNGRSSSLAGAQGRLPNLLWYSIFF